MAWVNLLDTIIYPTGTYYMSTGSDSPAATLGGVWNQLDTSKTGALKMWIKGTGAPTTDETIPYVPTKSAWDSINNIVYTGTNAIQSINSGSWTINNAYLIKYPSIKYALLYGCVYYTGGDSALGGNYVKIIPTTCVPSVYTGGVGVGANSNTTILAAVSCSVKVDTGHPEYIYLSCKSAIRGVNFSILYPTTT